MDLEHDAGPHSIEVSAIDSCGNTTIEGFDICQQMIYEVENLDVSNWNFEAQQNGILKLTWVELTSATVNQAGSAFSTAQAVSEPKLRLSSYFI